MNKFCFIVPMYNASRTLPTMLHSIVGQSYKNWRIILIDDVSDSEEQARCAAVIDKFRELLDITPDSQECQIDVHWNSHGNGKQWETANVLNGINKCENDDDIICRIDADDWLTDTDALAILNQAYNTTECDALWTAHRWGFSDKNISDVLPNAANPYEYPWVTSHLKTFRRRLLRGVSDENFRNQNGEYVKRCGDQAIYLPVLYNAKNRVFLPRVMYHYSIIDKPETYQTKDAVYQRDEANFLRARGYVK